MPGLGDKHLPLPQFSSDNPYWQDPRPVWGFLRPEYRPRLTAHDFLYASVWERDRRDVHGAYCVRTATVLTLKVQWRFFLRESIKTLLIKQKEKLHEKVA